MRKTTTLILFLALWAVGAAQAPVSNMYMFDIEVKNDSTFLFTKPKYLTFFNEKGYNNHPCFFSSDEIYFSCQGPFEDQPDIQMLRLNDLSRSQITQTSAGEYSPRPAGDYRSFSVIRQEVVNGDTLLRLWKMPLDRGAGSVPVFKDIINVGYYEWLSSQSVILHLNGSNGNPNQLVIADTYGIGSQKIISTNVGRCFKRTRDGQIIYVQKSSGNNRLNVLTRFDPRPYTSAKETVLVNTLPGSEDFAVMGDGTILMASGSALYKFKPGKDEDWQQIADFQEYNMRRITRMELSPDYRRIVMVVN